MARMVVCVAVNERSVRLQAWDFVERTTRAENSTADGEYQLDAQSFSIPENIVI